MQNKILLKVIFLFFNSVLLTYGLEFHDHLTDNEIFTIFNVPRNQVPEYEVVPVVHNLHMEDADPKVHLSTFGKTYNLNLELNSLLIGDSTPIYLGYNDGRGGVRYNQVPHDPSIRAFFDHQNKATITVEKQDKENTFIQGTLGDGLIVRPINSSTLNRIDSLQFPYPYDRWNVNSNYSPVKYEFYNPLDDSVYENGYVITHHIVYKGPEAKNNNSELVEKLQGNPIHMRGRRNIVDVVYPEILLSVDNGLLRKYNNDYKEVIKYIVALFNDVAARFREIQYPKIRLNIAGIVIPMETGAAPYLEENISSDGTVDSPETLKSVLKYFKNHAYFQNKNFDVTFLLTTMDLRVNHGDMTGEAYEGEPCGANTVGVAESEFSLRVTVVAHELGHIFGAHHDGHDFASSCPMKGYIMGDPQAFESLSFSTCSKNAFQSYFAKPGTQCYHNVPSVQNPYPKVYPGKLISLDEQCSMIYAGWRAAKVDESVCSSLTCTNGRSYVSNFQAYNGSPCGPNKICFDRECVAEV